jgi:hypothetical protein
MLQRRLANRSFDIVVLEYGGNDCDFNWQEISERPNDKHNPHTSLTVFIDTYIKMIHWLKEKYIEPIVTTLPPLEPQKFFDWFCNGLNKDNILKWLGTVNAIYRWQEKYSRAIEYIAYKTDVLLVDIRGAFLKHFRIDTGLNLGRLGVSVSVKKSHTLIPCLSTLQGDIVFLYQFLKFQ